MPTEADRQRVSSRIAELTRLEYHGGSSFWADRGIEGEKKVPADWHYFPPGTSKSEILAGLGEGYETKSWPEMNDDDRREVVRGYVKSDGFSKEEFGHMIENVVRDEGQNPATWFEGIPISPSKDAVKSDFDRMLDEYGRAAPALAPDRDGPER